MDKLDVEGMLTTHSSKETTRNVKSGASIGYDMGTRGNNHSPTASTDKILKRGNRSLLDLSTDAHEPIHRSDSDLALRVHCIYDSGVQYSITYIQLLGISSC